MTQIYIYFLLLYYWLRPRKAIIRPIFTKKKTENADAYNKKTLILWDPIYNYYQPLDAGSVVSWCYIHTS